MRFKKLTSIITALVCSVGIASYLPTVAEKTFAIEQVSNDFEVNYDGWYGNSDAVCLTAESGTGYNGSRGMTVSGRTSSDDGASSSKGFYLSGAVDYNYSLKVYSKTDETFHLSLLCIDETTGTETVINLADKTAKAGQWTELSANYKAPANSYEFRLTLTTDSTNDFSFDDVKITSRSGFSAEAAGEKGLKDEFANYFRVGNILNGGTVKNSAITANIIKDYNSIECENEMKPDATLVQSQCSGTDIAISLNNAAAIMDFCVQNNIAMRGHTFVWHSQTPVWFFKEKFDANGNWVTPDVMDKRMESYIKNMFSAIEQQYPQLNLYAYDVANECISDDSNRTANFGGAREPGDNYVEGGKSGWVAVYGDNSFVEKAFTYARKYAPEGCELYYNDYNEYWDHKRDTIYNMCKSLYGKGLLDGVGMQSHIPANATGFAGTDSYIEAMKKYLSIGCDVHISELDISLESGKYSLQEQADKYKAIFKAAMDWNKNPQSDGRVTLVAIWGPNDANSWLKEGSDGLLYDKNNQPKAAYTALTSMIPQSEWGDGSKYQGGSEIKPVEPNEYGWYFADGFEGSTCDWSVRGSGEVLTSGRTAYVGDESLLVKDRTDAWNGASKTLNRAFVAGNEYSFSANVMYFDGDATDKFYLKLQYTDANGDTQYDTISEATAVKGEWIQLANRNYKIPAGASGMQIYVETAESTNNFYIDEVIGAVAGTTIIGAGESQNVILGDINSDGVINSFDMVLARKGIVNGFSSSAEKLSADVDQNGEYNINDAVLIQKFILGQIKDFPVAEKTSNPIKDTPAVNPTAYMKDAEKSISEYALDGCMEEYSWVEYGTLKKYQYYSTTRERLTNVNVLLPPGYSENEKYPVLYAMHGYWEDEDSLVAMGKVRNMLGNLISTGDAEKMIVVFPYIYTSKTQEACSGLDLANSLNYDNFINDLTTDLMPYINSNFSVKTGRNNTAITGFSMGGRESLFIGLTRSDLFGYVGAACPAPGLTPGADPSMHPGQLQENQLKPAYDIPYLLMITGGGNDGTVGNQPSLYHNILNNNGINHIWHSVTSGEHDASSVQPHFYNYLRFIFKVN
ncbi:MAG: endo-1,4-beta-xylanase [Ruminococcus sp.]|nr:endo-1,4-beta-xylanase [Ruminococcus sp.]